MRAALAAALLLVSQTAPPGLFYDFEWRSAAMLSRWEAGDTVTSRGELSGKGRLRLTRLRDGRWHFAFWSPEGQGEGDIVGDVHAGRRPAAPGGLRAGVGGRLHLSHRDARESLVRHTSGPPM